LARALWAGRPLVWQIYPQNDGAHEAKLEAFLGALRVPDSLGAWHRMWNGLAPRRSPGDGATASLPPLPLGGGGGEGDGADEAVHWAMDTRQSLMDQPDLVTQLCGFVAGIRGAAKTG